MVGVAQKQASAGKTAALKVSSIAEMYSKMKIVGTRFCLGAYLCPKPKIWYNVHVLSMRKDHREAGTLTSRRWREAIPAAFSF
jgi:hypothetical protein